MSQVIYIRGDLAGHFSQRGDYSGVRADLRHLTELPEETIQTVIDAVRSAPGFLSRNGLTALVEKHIEDSTQATAVRRAIWNLAGRTDDGSQILEVVQDQDSEDVLTDEQIVRIKKLLPHLTAPAPAIERWRKADRVSGLTGVNIQDIQLVADMRPVFDDRREKIEAVVPIVTLRVVWESEAGIPDAIEAHLTRKQVSDLAEKLEHLNRKLSALDSFVGEQRLSVPDLSRLVGE